jgi:hypothetical protein
MDSFIINKIILQATVLSRNERGWRSIHIDILKEQYLIITDLIFNLDFEFCFAIRIPKLISQQEQADDEYFAEYFAEYRNDRELW